MSNRLNASTSPYLLAHAGNPVDWYPWGPEALEKARLEQKPIFLSIGYSACHWCHVMENESFSDPKVADILNKLFVNIKVDREERPDIDAIYMKSVVLMTGGGGWPTSVWLTPDLKPFYGGTYFPPTPRRGQPSFAQVLLSLAASWRDKRSEITNAAEQLISAVERLSEIAELAPIDGEDWLQTAQQICLAQYDEATGGFGGAPKFPQAMALRFLLLRAVQAGDVKLLGLVEDACEAMARGGIHDQLGGGFHRYSVDANWVVPHFEKMLYDNALLLGLYSELAAHSSRPLFAEVVASLVGWLGREMALPEGGFACSTDADSEGAEGRFFTWNPSTVAASLEAQESRLFTAFYGVTEEGNFEHQESVLTRRRELVEVAQELGVSPERAEELLRSGRDKALQARSARPAPARDDKAVASWNAQTVSALCRAARLSGQADAEQLALRAGGFLKEQFSARSGGEIPRLSMAGRAQGSAQAEDIGSLVLAFFDLYELTLDAEWVDEALASYELLLRDYWDAEKGLTAMTSPRTEDIPVRPYSFEDNATPSGHSLLLECARRHYRFTGDERSQIVWKKAIESVAPLAQRAPTGLGFALQSAALFEAPGQELVLAGSLSEASSFLQALQGQFLPNLLIAHAETPTLAAELGHGKTGTAAYLCAGNACGPPLASPEALGQALTRLSSAGR